MTDERDHDPYKDDDDLIPTRKQGKPDKAAVDAMLPEKPDTADLDYALAFADMNDFGNALRLQRRFGSDLLFVKDNGWYAWDGARWSRESGDREAAKMADQVAQKIKDEVLALRDNPKKYESRIPMLARHAMQSGNHARTSSMLTKAQNYLETSITTLDRDPYLVCCENGTIELRSTCDFRANRRSDRISRKLGVKFVPGAACPRFEKFLEEIMPDPEMRSFLQRIFGYCLTASTSEQAFFIFWGGGRNGKSTLMNIVRHIMGDYSMNSPVSTFLAKQMGQGGGSDASPDLARLPGARLVTAAEPPEGAKLDEGKVKELSSGELVTARHLNQPFFDFRPVFKAIVSTNHRPGIRGGDEGIWRRIRLVPFTVQIPLDKIDRNLEAALMKEAEGILQWMISGAEEWFSMGLNPPAAAIAAVDDYRSSEDPVRDFLDAKCEIPKEGYLDPSTGRPWETSAKRLREVYKAWCEEDGLEPMSQKAFGSKLASKGIRTRKTKGLTIYVGVAVKVDVENREKDGEGR